MADQVDRELDQYVRQFPTTGQAPSLSGGTPIMFPLPKRLGDLERAPEGMEWVWHGYLAKETITLLSSMWKVGKTTLTAHLLKAFATGGLFCGRTVRATKVLYVTEEAEWMWASRRDKIGIGPDHVYVQARPFECRPTMDQWVAFMRHVAVQVEKHGFGLVVIDPLTTLWPVEKENEAGEVSAALSPLKIITKAKAGVMLMHHFRKSDGGELTGSRGSGALMGIVDTILELRRFDPASFKDTKRTITGGGRFEDTPDELVVELTADGYVAHGDRGDVGRGKLLDVIRRVLTTDGYGWSYETLKRELSDAMGGQSPTKDRILKALEQGFNEGWIKQDGDGKKGSPYRYRLEVTDNNAIPE